METKEWRTEDKTDWPRGEWDGEPDKIQWPDEATGLPCLIVRNRSGALCGYVGVADGHPAYGIEYDDVKVSTEDGYPDVHGGLTFASFCAETKDESRYICHVPGPGEPHKVWWLGFDCHHAGDYAPGSDARYRQIVSEAQWRDHNAALGLGAPTGWGTTIEYRNVAYVREQCTALAKQLAGMSCLVIR